MREKLEEQKEYNWIKEYLSKNKWELMRLYAANAVGIGWKSHEGNTSKEIAILFYVNPKGIEGEIPGERIPPVIELFVPELNKTIDIQTDIIVSEPAQFE